MDQHTFHGLVAWKEKLFMKVGMVIVATQQGDTEALKMFMMKLEKLQNALDKKALEVVDPDKRVDLEIMSQKVDALGLFLSNASIDRSMESSRRPYSYRFGFV